MSSSCRVPTPSGPPPPSPLPPTPNPPCRCMSIREVHADLIGNLVTLRAMVHLPYIHAYVYATSPLHITHHYITAPIPPPAAAASRCCRSPVRATSNHWHASSRTLPTLSPTALHVVVFLRLSLLYYRNILRSYSCDSCGYETYQEVSAQRSLPPAAPVVTAAARSSTTPLCPRPSALSARRIKSRVRLRCR
jgi:hypothetical protein